MGTGSLIENLWIEHEVAAIWVGNDPPYQTQPTTGLTIRNSRIRDTYADGINLDNGTSNSLVEDVHLRNTGDDAIAVWSIKWTDWVKEKTYEFGPDFFTPEARNAPDQGIAHDNLVRNVSVQMPWRADCFAVYGGAGNRFKNSTCEDVLTYPGILVDFEFSPYPWGPSTTVFDGITLTRAGGSLTLEETGGALKFSMHEGSIADVLARNIDIVDPTYSGIEFRGYGSAFVAPGTNVSPWLVAAADAAAFSNVKLDSVHVTNAGRYGIEIVDDGGRGQVRFVGVTVAGSAVAALQQGGAPDSFFLRGAGNSGW